MDASTPAANLIALLDDPNLAALLRKNARECLTWESFLAMPLPAGMSAYEAWDVVQAIGRYYAIPVPIPDLEDRLYWYTPTVQITRLLSNIERRCSTGSRLHRTLVDTNNRRFLVKARINEAIASTRLDGLGITQESAENLLRLNRAPRNDTERLLMNTLTVSAQLEQFVDVPFSPELLRHLGSLVLKNVESRALTRVECRGGMDLPLLAASEYVDTAERQMQHICAYANHESGDEADQPAARLFLIQSTLRYYHPLPDWNAVVSRLAARLYALKHDLPVLAHLAFSAMALEWEDGRIAPPDVIPSGATFDVLRTHNEANMTAFVTLGLQLMSVGLARLENYVTTRNARDEALQLLLKDDIEINHRQLAVLGRALRRPDAEFRIRYHKTANNIAYSTARTDLTDLADRGYLRFELRGKAHVFVPADDLAARIERDHS